MRKSAIIPGSLALAGLLVGLGGCAAPLSRGPVVAVERATLESPQAEYDAVEINHHTDGLTYSLVAHDGVRINLETPEDEAHILIRDRRAERIIEALTNEGVPRHRRILHAW